MGKDISGELPECFGEVMSKIADRLGVSGTPESFKKWVDERALSSRYRLLTLNERIEHMDQVLLDDTENWAPVDRWAVGMRSDPGVLMPIRRRNTDY